MGDFNETHFACEHFSWTARPEGHMRAFREVTDEIAFQDLGWSGVPYTWDNRQFGNANVKATLDQAFANEEFRQQYEHIQIHHLSAAESDHCFVVAGIRETLVKWTRGKK